MAFVPFMYAFFTSTEGQAYSFLTRSFLHIPGSVHCCCHFISNEEFHSFFLLNHLKKYRKTPSKPSETSPELVHQNCLPQFIYLHCSRVNAYMYGRPDVPGVQQVTIGIHQCRIPRWNHQPVYLRLLPHSRTRTPETSDLIIITAGHNAISTVFSVIGTSLFSSWDHFSQLKISIDPNKDVLVFFWQFVRVTSP